MPLPQRFVVKVNDREHEVSIFSDSSQSDSRQHQIQVDGQTWTVQGSAPQEYLLQGPAGSQNHRVHLNHGASKDGPTQAQLAGKRCELLVRDARDVALEAALGTGDGGDSQLTAPMPGRVVRVLAKVGDTVEAGKAIVIIEAMKMENELACPRSGKVARIAVKEGDTVDPGQLLCEIVDDSAAE